MDRRAFLKKGGLGSVAVGALPVLAEALAIPVSASGGQATFHFAALSGGPTIGSVVHRLIMAGDGRFNDAQVEGHGVFNHVNVDPALPLPKPVLASGTWKATRLVSFNSIGSSGVTRAGVLKMDVDLVREIPSPGVFAAHIEVVCNIPFAGLFTGLPEGFTLTGLPVTFSPLTPTIGITIFGTAVEQKD